MKLFEATWREGFKFYERYYDTNLKKSVKNSIELPYEWYEPLSTGQYSYILDESIKLEKKQGYNPKEGRAQYGFLDPAYRNIRDNYWGKDSYNLNPRVWFLDIETRAQLGGFPVPELAKEQICLIQIYDNKSDHIIMLGLRDWKHKEDYEEKFEKPLKYLVFNSEIELLEAYLDLFSKLDPLLLYAWNGAYFDYPYIHNRLKNLGFDTNRMSNYADVKYQESEFNGRKEFKLSTPGHYYIDLLDVYKKFTYTPRPTYALDYIAEVELGEKKVPHPEYKKWDDYYTGEYVLPTKPDERQLNSKIYKEVLTNGLTDEARELAHSEFCFYGYKDPLLIYKIEKKLNLTSLMLMIADKQGVTLGDSLGTVKQWSQFMANQSMLSMKVMPPKQTHDSPNIVGGFVKDPQKGKHKWVLSADVNSMYPLLSMVGFNMSSETYIPVSNLPADLRDIVLMYFNDQDESKRFEIPEEVWKHTQSLLEKYNISLAINGAAFSKDKIGIIPETVNMIYSERKKSKKIQFKYEQQKVLIKSILKDRNDKR